MSLDGWARAGLVVGAGFWIVTGSLLFIGVCVLVALVFGLADQVR